MEQFVYHILIFCRQSFKDLQILGAVFGNLCVSLNTNQLSFEQYKIKADKDPVTQF